MSLFSLSLIPKMRSAWIAISVACHSVPPSGWWIITSEFGRAYLLPLVPAVRSIAPIDAAIPIHTVTTSHFTYCMVSYIAIPAVTDPPGELTYITISLSGSCFSRYSICATMTLEVSWFTQAPKNIILSSNNLE